MGPLGEQHRKGSYVEKAAAGQRLGLLAGKLSTAKCVSPLVAR
jgi:hypothetical protein